MKKKATREIPMMDIPGIALRQIVIDQTEWVTLWGYQLGEPTPLKTDYVLEFETLNKLLSLHGDLGDEIQMLLVERLEGGLESAQVVDIEQTFGMPALLDRCWLRGYHPQQEVSPGHWEENSRITLIEGLTPEVRPFPDKKSLYRQNYYKCVRLLIKSYRLYLGYLELDFDEATAMEMAGLRDEVKFKMAYYAWKVSNGETIN